MKKVIGYIRVSTEYQKLKENSINNQIKSINDYCDNDNMCLIDIFEDNGVSGMNSDRNGLNQLFDKVKKDNIDMVIVYSLSRLGRKLKDVIGFVEMLDKHNVQFVSLKENFNNNDIVGKLMFNILGSINEFEVNLLSQRISDVKQYKKSVREVYSGKICFGLKRNGKKLIDNNTELETLKLIHKLRNNKMSYFKISDYLNERNILSKENKRWYGSSVRSVYLNNVISVTN
jgi:site-specific DNA recombinase